MRWAFIFGLAKALTSANLRPKAIRRTWAFCFAKPPLTKKTKALPDS